MIYEIKPIWFLVNNTTKSKSDWILFKISPFQASELTYMLVYDRMYWLRTYDISVELNSIARKCYRKNNFEYFLLAKTCVFCNLNINMTKIFKFTQVSYMYLNVLFFYIILL